MDTRNRPPNYHMGTPSPPTWIPGSPCHIGTPDIYVAFAFINKWVVVLYLLVITTGKQSCGKVMFSQVSVSSHVLSGGLVSLVPGPFGMVLVCSRVGGWVDVWWNGHPEGAWVFAGDGYVQRVGMSGGGYVQWVGMSGNTHPLNMGPGIPWDTVSKWEVHIIMECFLVLINSTSIQYWFI